MEQTKKSKKTKFREHLYYARSQWRNNSALCEHFIDTNQTLEIENLNLIHRVNKPSELHIPLDNILFHTIKTKKEDLTPHTPTTATPIWPNPPTCYLLLIVL